MPRIRWNKQKGRINLAKHDVDFRQAALIFEGNPLIRIDDRFDYGEERWIAIGPIPGTMMILHVVYMHREDIIRLISARPADEKESAEYYEDAGYNASR
jgi:uncharacterized protein